MNEFPPVFSEMWKGKIIAELKGKTFEELQFQTPEGFELQPFYTKEDKTGLQFTEIPHRKPGWIIRQDFEVKDTDTANEKAHVALSGGAESIGYNLSEVDINNDIISRLISDIDIKKVQLHFTGIDLNSLKNLSKQLPVEANGTVALNNYGETELEFLTEEMNLMHEKNPGINFFVVSNEDATSAILQVKNLTLKAQGILNFLKEKKNKSKHLPPLHFSIALSGDYFSDIARLRALRIIWMREAKKFEGKCSGDLMIHAWNAPKKYSDELSHYHILSATTSAMSAIIGGCDSLSLNPVNLPGKPDDFSERIFRNIQLLLKHESYFDKVHDPAKGSYFLENLTDKIVRAVLEF